ncbi:Bifunctional lycopene cyclase/phytoene synthase [Escovopsis weberi]|uniref:15-cis-phytoene synthase n=1 Tax=Escovopsis weberi TaxID=150374 RepID=A0A0N0RU00_ESCWE|nr:Bifunctional lycopene cyclase/phytoene synthase [Escovopsis weberi]
MINTVIVIGLVCFDHAIAITEYHIARISEEVQAKPSLAKLVRVYKAERRRSHENVIFLHGLSEAVRTVSQKSQSMYMGSAMFQGGLRIDLLLLYYFCRVMDDLVDEAPNQDAAELAIRQCSWALKCRFGEPYATSHPTILRPPQYDPKPSWDEPALPSSSALIYAIDLLPVSRLALAPLLGLIDGFKTDLVFARAGAASPIATEDDLELYAYNVASVVAVSIVQLVFRHHPPAAPRCPPAEWRARVLEAAETMGQALQYVNMARDVERDAAIGRVYLPQAWLSAEGLKPADVVAAPHDARVTKLRMRLLDRADAMYRRSRGAIDELPREARASVRAVVESYMAIGREVRKGPRTTGREKLKLSPWRRLWVVWRAMCAR